MSSAKKTQMEEVTVTGIQCDKCFKFHPGGDRTFVNGWATLKFAQQDLYFDLCPECSPAVKVLFYPHEGL